MSRGPMGEEKPGRKCNETMKFPRRPLPSGENCAMLYPYACRQIPAGPLSWAAACFLLRSPSQNREQQESIRSGGQTKFGDFLKRLC